MPNIVAGRVLIDFDANVTDYKAALDVAQAETRQLANEMSALQQQAGLVSTAVPKALSGAGISTGKSSEQLAREARLVSQQAKRIQREESLLEGQRERLRQTRNRRRTLEDQQERDALAKAQRRLRARRNLNAERKKVNDTAIAEARRARAAAAAALQTEQGAVGVYGGRRSGDQYARGPGGQFIATGGASFAPIPDQTRQAQINRALAGRDIPPSAISGSTALVPVAGTTIRAAAGGPMTTRARLRYEQGRRRVLEAVASQAYADAERVYQQSLIGDRVPNRPLSASTALVPVAGTYRRTRSYQPGLGYSGLGVGGVDRLGPPIPLSQRIAGGLEGFNNRLEGRGRGRLGGASVLAGGFVGFYGARGLIRGAIEYADAWRAVQNSIAQTISPTDNLGERVQELFDIANESRIPLDGLRLLYQRLQFASGDLGASQEDLRVVLRSVAQSLAIEGRTAEQTRGALLQLSQGLGGGIFRAEEFNSIVEGAPVLLRNMARNLDGTGVSLSELRKRVQDAELTSKDAFAALLAGAEEMDRAFRRIVPTIGQSLTRVSNSFTRAFGSVFEELDLGERIGDSLDEVVSALDTIGDDASGVANQIRNSLEPIIALFGQLSGALSTQEGILGVLEGGARIAGSGIGFGVGGLVGRFLGGPITAVGKVIGSLVPQLRLLSLGLKAVGLLTPIITRIAGAFGGFYFDRVAAFFAGDAVPRFADAIYEATQAVEATAASALLQVSRLENPTRGELATITLGLETELNKLREAIRNAREGIQEDAAEADAGGGGGASTGATIQGRRGAIESARQRRINADLIASVELGDAGFGDFIGGAIDTNRVRGRPRRRDDVILQAVADSVKEAAVSGGRIAADEAEERLREGEFALAVLRDQLADSFRGGVFDDTDEAFFAEFATGGKVNEAAKEFEETINDIRAQAGNVEQSFENLSRRTDRLFGDNVIPRDPNPYDPRLGDPLGAPTALDRAALVAGNQIGRPLTPEEEASLLRRGNPYAAGAGFFDPLGAPSLSDRTAIAVGNRIGQPLTPEEELALLSRNNPYAANPGGLLGTAGQLGGPSALDLRAQATGNQIGAEGERDVQSVIQDFLAHIEETYEPLQVLQDGLHTFASNIEGGVNQALEGFVFEGDSFGDALGDLGVVVLQEIVRLTLMNSVTALTTAALSKLAAAATTAATAQGASAAGGAGGGAAHVGGPLRGGYEYLVGGSGGVEHIRVAPGMSGYATPASRFGGDTLQLTQNISAGVSRPDVFAAIEEAKPGIIQAAAQFMDRRNGRPGGRRY